mgnify:FL=1
MNERKINVLEVGEYKKNLEDVTHYIDDCINRIYGGIKALTSQNIIEGEISNTLENAYEELSKIRTEVNEELDSFTGWIGKNIEDTTLLDERHARELENELNSMEFFKDGYTISGDNAFLTGNNNMKFNSPNGTTKEDTTPTQSTATKDAAVKTDKNESKNLANDKNETSNESSSADGNKKVNDKTKGTIMGTGFERGAGGGDYELASSLSWLDKTKTYTPSEVVDKIQKDKEYHSDNNVPLMKKSDGTVANSIKEFAADQYKDPYYKPVLDAINNHDEKNLSYEYIIKMNVDGQQKDWRYKTTENLTPNQVYSEFNNYLKANTTKNSKVDFPYSGELGINIETKDN